MRWSTYSPVLLILVLATFRLLPHPPNVTPIAAMALFAGVYLADHRLAFLVPLAALFVSDLVLGLHDTMLFTYAGLALTVAIGLGLREHTWGRVRSRPYRFMAILLAALAGSVVFFLLTNLGAWLSHDLYPKTGAGLWMAYAAGLPFFRNSLIGDLGFTLLAFTGHWLSDRCKVKSSYHPAR